MGFATAKPVGKTHLVILCGRSTGKLRKAVAELQGLGIDKEAFAAEWMKWAASMPEEYAAGCIHTKGSFVLIAVFACSNCSLMSCSKNLTLDLWLNVGQNKDNLEADADLKNCEKEA